MSSPAELIAANLAALPHPDGAPRQLSGFSTQLLPEALHAQIQQTAKDIGEAIIHLLETNGYTVTNQASQPTQTPDEPPLIASVHCHHCDERVLQMNISTPSKVLTGHHFALIECPKQ